MHLKKIFYIIVIALSFSVGFKIVPVLYRGYISVPGACQEAAETYKRYGQEYLLRDVNERLDVLGIGKDKRLVNMEVENGRVYITITYIEMVDFYGQYQKVFHFDKTCSAPASSIL